VRPPSPLAPGAEPEWAVPWRRNLAAIWFAQATAIFGFWFCLPFLPLYLERDLGVHGGPGLTLWSGLTFAAAGLGQFVASPVWGALSDRFGRKSMLLRAMLLGSLTVGLMGFARSPMDLMILRFLQGATSGVTAAGTTLVATGTPRAHVGWALGVAGSAVAVGSAVGRLVGGIAESAWGPRSVFWLGGVFLFMAMGPVVPLVRELRGEGSHASSDKEAARALRIDRTPVAPLVLLLFAIALAQMSYSGAQPLVPLLAILLAGAGAGSLTGAAFTAAGVGSIIGAIAYSRPARRFGYRTVVAAAALGGGAVIALLGGAGSSLVVVIAMLGAGLFFNAATTALYAMLGLESPTRIQGRVFGFAASAVAAGYTAGPVLAGVVGAATDVRVGLYTVAGVAVLLVALAVWRLREPAR
jgi:DHA1 family multidrug resistance protein-like MFS transporter